MVVEITKPGKYIAGFDSIGDWFILRYIRNRHEVDNEMWLTECLGSCKGQERWMEGGMIVSEDHLIDNPNGVRA